MKLVSMEFPECITYIQSILDEFIDFLRSSKSSLLREIFRDYERCSDSISFNNIRRLKTVIISSFYSRFCLFLLFAIPTPAVCSVNHKLLPRTFKVILMMQL